MTFKTMQAELRDRMRKSQSTPVLFLLDESDVPYTLWVFLNCRGMWHHKWRYSEDNKNCTDADREKYKKYNNMTEQDLRLASQEEQLEHVVYAAPKARFVEGVKRAIFCETISDEGRKTLTKFIKGWKKLQSIEDIKSKIEEVWWDMEDNEHLEEIIWRGNKRKRGESEMPPLPDSNSGVSPKSVVLFPGDEGYDDYVMQCEGADSSDEDDDGDE